MLRLVANNSGSLLIEMVLTMALVLAVLSAAASNERHSWHALARIGARRSLQQALTEVVPIVKQSLLENLSAPATVVSTSRSQQVNVSCERLALEHSTACSLHASSPAGGALNENVVFFFD